MSGEGRRESLAYLTLSSFLAALTAVSAQLEFRLGPVPYTMQNFAVMLAALILRPRYAALSQLTYLAIVAVGMPAAAGLKGGPTALLGYTAGYLWMFLVSSFLMSYLSRAYARHSPNALLNPSLRDKAVLLLLLLVAVAPLYAGGFLVFCFYALQPTMLGGRLTVWSEAAVAMMGLRGLDRLLTLFVVSVLVFVPQDLLVDHLLAITVAPRILRLMRDQGLDVP